MVKIDKNTFKNTLRTTLVAILILVYFLFSLGDKYSIILLCLAAIILSTIIHFLVEFIGDYLYKK
ncbi:hypothetical protein [Staphylococcus hominis]|uniref:hypothetical protein n=1 Tax=Staphylococcus hominis TaxID=1290 RepID=UPI001F57BB79|nr:hypothetical protein [Staphylococcus hominis]